MSAQHTLGRLTADGTVLLFARNAGGFSISGCPDAEANARRLAACWNACDGVRTDFLEMLAAMPDQEVASYERLLAQRDELLALLRQGRNDLAIAASSWNEDENQQLADFHRNRVLGLIKRVDAAIAKATGQEGGAA